MIPVADEQTRQEIEYFLFANKKTEHGRSDEEVEGDAESQELRRGPVCVDDFVNDARDRVELHQQEESKYRRYPERKRVIGRKTGIVRR